MSAQIALKKYRAPQAVVGFFTFRGIIKSMVFLGIFLGFIVAINALGYATTYDTQSSRNAFAATLEANAGFKLLYGQAHHIETIPGYTVWRCLSAITMVGSIWALLYATKIFRGQEEAGRWEMLLTGRTSPGKATANALLGIGGGLVLLYAILSAVLVTIGKNPNLNFSTQSTLFFSLAIVSSIAIFLSLGALVSQFAPTRKKAAGYTAMLFGLFFVTRAVADLQDGLHWLIYVTPLGWVLSLKPLIGSQPIWLVPIGLLVLACSVGSIVLASKRDVGSSILPDKDSAKPHTRMLNSVLAANLRLTRGALLGWAVGIGLIIALLSSMAKSVAEAIGESNQFSESLTNLSGSSMQGAVLFLGMAFFMCMLALMLAAAGVIGSIRDDEAKGYLDNFLVRGTSRLEWLGSRITIAVGSVFAIGLLAGAVCWFTSNLQGTDLPLGTMLQAGINAAVPSVLIIGLGIFFIGIKPRLASIALYGFIIWSFLLELIGSAVKMSHWIADTSILHHLALVPATDANWGVNCTILALGCALGLIGTYAFTKRDLEAE